MKDDQNRHIHYIGSSQKDLSKLPKEVKEEIAYDLLSIQKGERPAREKTLSGKGNANLRELRIRHDKNAYRAVYTVQYKEVVFVLHVFQKKSTKGISTPKPEMDLIEARLKEAKKLYQDQYKGR